jgi:hypothetical protein
MDHLNEYGNARVSLNKANSKLFGVASKINPPKILLRPEASPAHASKKMAGSINRTSILSCEEEKLLYEVDRQDRNGRSSSRQSRRALDLNNLFLFKRIGTARLNCS